MAIVERWHYSLAGTQVEVTRANDGEVAVIFKCQSPDELLAFAPWVATAFGHGTALRLYAEFGESSGVPEPGDEDLLWPELYKTEPSPMSVGPDPLFSEMTLAALSAIAGAGAKATFDLVVDRLKRRLDDDDWRDRTPDAWR